MSRASDYQQRIEHLEALAQKYHRRMNQVSSVPQKKKAANKAKKYRQKAISLGKEAGSRQ